MSANPLAIVGNTYEGSSQYPYSKDPVVIGAAYLIARDYDTPKVVVARKRYADILVVHEDRRYRAGMINPPTTQVGDLVSVLETVDATKAFRANRRATVTEVNDDGIVVEQAGFGTFPVKYWVFHTDQQHQRQHNRRDPKRRQMVLDRLSNEGMKRIGDTGYATSAREFFDHFNLPRPEVGAWAFVDVERDIKWADMGYDARSMFSDDGVSSLREAHLKGRAKIVLPKSTCRCKEVTEKEAVQGWDGSRRWKVIKLHKVECIWCMNQKEVQQAVDNGDL